MATSYPNYQLPGPGPSLVSPRRPTSIGSNPSSKRDVDQRLSSVSPLEARERPNTRGAAVQAGTQERYFDPQGPIFAADVANRATTVATKGSNIVISDLPVGFLKRSSLNSQRQAQVQGG